jgi:hypothetical protein
MVAVMAAFAAKYLDTSIKRPEQIEETTGLPVLGSIFEFEPTARDSKNFVASLPKNKVTDVLG